MSVGGRPSPVDAGSSMLAVRDGYRDDPAGGRGKHLVRSDRDDPPDPVPRMPRGERTADTVLARDPEGVEAGLSSAVSRHRPRNDRSASKNGCGPGRRVVRSTVAEGPDVLAPTAVGSTSGWVFDQAIPTGHQDRISVNDRSRGEAIRRVDPCPPGGRTDAAVGAASERVREDTRGLGIASSGVALGGDEHVPAGYDGLVEHVREVSGDVGRSMPKGWARTPVTTASFAERVEA